MLWVHIIYQPILVTLEVQKTNDDLARVHKPIVYLVEPRILFLKTPKSPPNYA